MQTLRGIVEHENIRLITPHSLPEGTEIEFEPRLAPAERKSASIGSNSPELYALLGERFNSGNREAVARHDEHQP